MKPGDLVIFKSNNSFLKEMGIIPGSLGRILREYIPKPNEEAWHVKWFKCNREIAVYARDIMLKNLEAEELLDLDVLELKAGVTIRIPGKIY